MKISANARFGVRLLAASAAVLAVCSCSSPGHESAATGPPGTLTDDQIESAASSYVAAGFAKVNRATFPTQQHAGNPPVNVYVNQTADSTYRAIDPGAKPKDAFAFPVGSMLVKEMLGASGAPEVLTVMYKKAPGYDPANGDWWYGRLTPGGTPTNAAFAGKVDFCIGCHTGTKQWDFAWGAGNTH